MTEPDAWQSEAIPDGDTLYMRVHVNSTINGELHPGVFVDRHGAMSANWQKYCPAPEDARRKAKEPAKNGVISATAGRIRSVPQVVEHTPIQYDPDPRLIDRSHTDVRGQKTSEVRLKLLDAFDWCLAIGAAAPSNDRGTSETSPSSA